MRLGLRSGSMALALVMLGCVAETERLPHRPGAGGGSMNGGNGSDGGPAQGEEGQVTGRVCRILDLRNPLECAPSTDLSGIVIAERGGTGRATTAANGSFSLAASLDDAAVLEAAPGPAPVVPSVIAVELEDGRAEGVVLPMVDSTAWDSLLLALDAIAPDGTGAIAAYVKQESGSPALGAQITDISTSVGVFYNVGGPQDWLIDDVTGRTGAVLVLGVTPPVAELTAIDESGTVFVRVVEIPVGPDAITFVDITLE